MPTKKPFTTQHSAQASSTTCNRDPRIDSVRCYVLPGHIRECKPEYRVLYEQAYSFFRVFMGYEMRSENLSDIDEKLSSDSFMLFQDIFTLFYEHYDKHDKTLHREIVGLFCFDTKNVRSSAVLDQSYFKAYPKNILDIYIKSAGSIMTIGHLLVHPNWRRKKIGIGLSDILVWFMHQRFIESGADLMIYFTRNNRGTNDLGTKFGGEVVVENTEYGGLAADIILTWPDKVTMDCGDDYLNQLSNQLWNSRTICFTSELGYSIQDSVSKKAQQDNSVYNSKHKSRIYELYQGLFNFK